MTHTYISWNDAMALFGTMHFIVNRGTRLRHIEGDFNDKSREDLELGLANALSKLQASLHSGMEDIISAEHLKALASKLGHESLLHSLVHTPVAYVGDVAIGRAPERHYRADAVERPLTPYLDAVKFETLLHYFGRVTPPALKNGMLAKKLGQLDRDLEGFEALPPHVAQLVIGNVTAVKEHAAAIKGRLAVPTGTQQLPITDSAAQSSYLRI